jgi:PHD/YefM family antitoxin component YafN of YafNO toxin-antitoxin module
MEVKKMPITNATELRKKLFETIGNVIEYNEPVTVNTKKGNAVIISESDYNAMMETIYIMSQPKLVKNIKDGEKENPEKMKAYDPSEKW